MLALHQVELFNVAVEAQVEVLDLVGSGNDVVVADDEEFEDPIDAAGGSPWSTLASTERSAVRSCSLLRDCGVLGRPGLMQVSRGEVISGDVEAALAMFADNVPG